MRRMSFLFLLILGALAMPGRADALKCRRPPAVSVVYPRRNAVVPRNSVVFLTRYRWGSRFDSKMLELHDVQGKRIVPAKVIPSPWGGMVRIVPKRPLRPRRTFVVKYDGGSIGLFKTSQRVVKDPMPRLVRPQVVFGPVVRSKWAGTGRPAEITSRVVRVGQPVVLEVHIFRGRGRRAFAFAHSGRVLIANMLGCSRVGSMPARGTFRIIATPWSGTGRKGRAVPMRGQIK